MLAHENKNGILKILFLSKNLNRYLKSSGASRIQAQNDASSS